MSNDFLLELILKKPYLKDIEKDMKKLGLLLRKTREIIGFLIENANVYYDRSGGEVSKSLLWLLRVYS